MCPHAKRGEMEENMKKIFWSIVIILLDFNLTAAGYSVGLIPDFIGFWLLSEAIIEFKEQSVYFQKVHSLTSFMIFFSLISYCLDCLSGNISNYLLLFVIQLFYTLMCLYVIYLILLGLKDTELLKGIDLKTSKVFRYFIIYAVVTITIIIQIFIPSYMLMRYIATLVTCPIFLIELYRSINCYQINNKIILKTK